MKYYTFYRENNNFKDILQDVNLKKFFEFQLRYFQHMIIGNDEVPEDMQSYILLKYGDDIKNNSDIFIDRNPVPYKDYSPDSNRPDKFKKL